MPRHRNRQLREMLADCYRQVNDQEFTQVRDQFPNDADLRDRLELMKLRGDGVAPEMSIGFFVAALEQSV